uniref:S-adenosylmethionine:tRNA ribosyltransferase-isomerase n=1 Tax=uncultured beta proteobacterium HF0130_04F21 TaxID=710819 RepID=E0XST0_9PROT|nr:s-adenosylmethionine:tRNA-ribosyltransferase-isomerase (queuine synthetase) [uncultured beta proteobacterium HF0130_04F21]
MKRNFRLEDFDYELPDNLIAQYPAKTRSESRLLNVDLSDKKNLNFEELSFVDLASKLKKDDLLIFNNSRVIPAKLNCVKSTGGSVEILITNKLQTEKENIFLCNAMLKPSKKIFLGQKLKIKGSSETLTIIENNLKSENNFVIEFKNPIDHILKNFGIVPLPPYIKRHPEKQDYTDYQNIFATTPGSIAVPTAGLHFDNLVFKKLAEKGVKYEFVTLHVGIGTFQPIRVVDISRHEMHSEFCSVSNNCAKAINKATRENRRIIAVGTTSLRVLESLASIEIQEKSHIKSVSPRSWRTNLFVKPGFKFQMVSGLITNFHLPKSTLLILVSTFLGHETCMRVYKEAIKKEFKFFSFGDAMMAIKPQ